MVGPKPALQDLETLLHWPLQRWTTQLAGCGMGAPNPSGIEAGRTALRHALARFGTPHDVLARMGRDLRILSLEPDVHRTALDVVAFARGVARRSVELPFDTGFVDQARAPALSLALANPRTVRSA